MLELAERLTTEKKVDSGTRRARAAQARRHARRRAAEEVHREAGPARAPAQGPPVLHRDAARRPARGAAPRAEARPPPPDPRAARGARRADAGRRLRGALPRALDGGRRGGVVLPPQPRLPPAPHPAERRGVRSRRRATSCCATRSSACRCCSSRSRSRRSPSTRTSAPSRASRSCSSSSRRMLAEPEEAPYEAKDLRALLDRVAATLGKLPAPRAPARADRARRQEAAAAGRHDRAASPSSAGRTCRRTRRRSTSCSRSSRRTCRSSCSA